MADSTDITAYLDRLGLDREPVSVDGLFRLQRAHVERIPYETTWIHLGERWSVDREESLRRIAHRRRGGYCFHLNGALSLLLESIGYDVTLHVGGVHGPDGATDDNMHNHLVLLVHGLPSDANPAGTWYVDTGLGDGLHEPLPLTEGIHRQGPFGYELAATHGAVGDWHFNHDPLGSFHGMAFRSTRSGIDEFATRNVFLSTSAESSFVKTVTVQRRDAGGVDILRGLVLRRIDGRPPIDTTLRSRSDWFDSLRQTFDLPLDDADERDRDRLWSSAAAAHDAWERAQALVNGRSGTESTRPASSGFV